MQRPCAKLASPVTHSVIVAAYLHTEEKRLRAELDWFGQETQSKEAALKRVTEARDTGNKRLSHQCCLPKSVSPAAFAALSAVLPQLMSATDFANLHSCIVTAFQQVHGAGPLFAYDTALRFGAFLNAPYPMEVFYPTEVYTHAGTAAGATRLLKRRPRPTELISSFPAAFRALPAYQLENLLCRYSECL